MAVEFTVRSMEISDYAEILAMWQQTEGVGLSSADSKERIAAYLERNPGCSFTAWSGQQLVGAVLCGHDGRRGYLHHLAVLRDWRKQGVGSVLVMRCLEALQAAGIDKCHLFVFKDNVPGRIFWEKAGWHERDDLVIMSHSVP